MDTVSFQPRSRCAARKLGYALGVYPDSLGSTTRLPIKKMKMVNVVNVVIVHVVVHGSGQLS